MPGIRPFGLLWLKSDMGDPALANLINRGAEFLLNREIVTHLVLRHLDHDYTDPQLGKVLLELDASIDCEEDIKLRRRELEQGDIQQLVPTHFVNGLGIVLSNSALTLGSTHSSMRMRIQ